LKNTQGTGIIPTVMKAIKDIAHAKPNLWTICTVKSGKADDTMKRMKVLAANTEAPY
jgi:hypothetical protein